MRVEKVTQASDELLGALAALLPQLSASVAPPKAAELRKIVATPGSNVLVARDETGGIVGTLTLVCFQTTTGVHARIEDVVVDRAARGRGAGEALISEAIRLATAAGAPAVDLTSRAGREAANRLYARLGFEPRDTDVYRLRLER